MLKKDEQCKRDLKKLERSIIKKYVRGSKTADVAELEYKLFTHRVALETIRRILVKKDIATKKEIDFMIDNQLNKMVKALPNELVK